MSRETVIAQNKDYSGKIPKNVMDKTINDFKDNTKQLKATGKTVKGYQINGGTGLTKGAQESFDKFKEDIKENGQFALYLNNDQVNKLINTLQNKVKNKNVNKNVNKS